MKKTVLILSLFISISSYIFGQSKQELPAWEIYKDKTSGSIYSGLSSPAGKISEAEEIDRNIIIKPKYSNEELTALKVKIEEAITIFPLASLYFKLGNVYYFKKDYQMALQCFKIAAFRDYEEVWWAYYNGACCASILKDLPYALKYLDLAIEWGFNDIKLIKSDMDLNYIRSTTQYNNIISKLQDKNFVPKIYKITNGLFTENAPYEYRWKTKYREAGLAPLGQPINEVQLIRIQGNLVEINFPAIVVPALISRGIIISKPDIDKLKNEEIACELISGLGDEEVEKTMSFPINKSLLGKYEFRGGNYIFTFTHIQYDIPQKKQYTYQVTEGLPASDRKVSALFKDITVTVKANTPRLLPVYETFYENTGWPSISRMIKVEIFPELFGGPAIWYVYGERYGLEDIP